MPRVLTDKFKITLSRSELMLMLKFVRAEIQQIPDEAAWSETSVWRTRYIELRDLESKILVSYNTSGTQFIEDGDNNA